jgi:hypothetical protein
MVMIMAVDNILKGKEVKSGDVVKIVGEAEYRMFGFKDEPKVEKFFIPVDYKGRVCEIKMGKKSAVELAAKLGQDTAKWIGSQLVLTVVKYDKGPGIQCEVLEWKD